MPYCSTPRAAPCSAILREAPSCSRWENTQTQPDSRWGRKDFRTLRPTCDVSIKSPTLVFRGLCARGERKTLIARGYGGHQREKGLLNTTRLTHTQELKVACTVPTQVQGRWGSSAERGSGYKPTSLSQNLFPIDNHLQSKNYFSPLESYQVHKPHLLEGLCPEVSRWPIQNKPTGILGLTCFVWVFFVVVFVLTLQIFGLDIVVSDFVFIGFLVYDYT